MWSREIVDLVPSLRDKAREWLKRCATAGIRVAITCTRRTGAVQYALFAQGRKPLSVVNELRKKCGLWALTEAENKRPVTWTMQSKHIPMDEGSDDPALNGARAWDFVVLAKNGALTWNPKVDVDGDGIADYEEAGKIAEELGLRWGGRFKNPDRPHIEGA